MTSIDSCTSFSFYEKSVFTRNFSEQKNVELFYRLQSTGQLKITKVSECWKLR